MKWLNLKLFHFTIWIFLAYFVKIFSFEISLKGIDNFWNKLVKQTNINFFLVVFFLQFKIYLKIGLKISHAKNIVVRNTFKNCRDGSEAA